MVRDHSMSPSRTLTFLVAAALVAACQEAPPPTEGAARLEEDQRIGSTDVPETALTEIGGVAVAADGTMYVRQLVENTVRVFGEDGRPVGRVGGPGGGPGEFQALWTTQIFGDTLWLTDLRALRATAFSEDERVLRTVTVPVDQQADLRGRPAPIGVTREGDVVLRVKGTGSDDPADRLAVYRAAEDRMVEIARLQPDPGDIQMMSSRGPIALAAPVESGSLVEPSPDGRTLVVVHRRGSEPLRVLRLSTDGDTLFDRTLERPSRPIPGAFADSLTAAWTDQLSEFLDRAEAADLIDRHLVLPEAWPAASGLVAAGDGRTWIRTSRRGDPAGGQWLVLDSEGRPTQEVAAPAGVELLAASADRAWGSVTDTLDVPYLVRYRLSR